jgi:hypothetical protein
VIEQYATFPQLVRLITERHQPASPAPARAAEWILSRHAWRRRHPLGALAYGWEKFRVARHSARNRAAALRREARQ